MFKEAYNTYKSRGVPMTFELFNAKLSMLQRRIFSLMGLLIIFTGIVLILSNMDDLTNGNKVWYISVGYAFLAGGLAFVVNSLVRRRSVVGNLEILEDGLELELNQNARFIPYDSIKQIIYSNGMLNNYFR